MDLIPTFDTVTAQTFDEACAAVVGLIHSTEVEWHDISCLPVRLDQTGILRFLSGENAPLTLIAMLDKLEAKGRHLQQVAIFGHSTLYYLLRLHWPDSLDVIKHDPEEGYVARFLGHHLYTHPKIRDDSVLVGGRSDQKLLSVVGSRVKPDKVPFIMSR